MVDIVSARGGKSSSATALTGNSWAGGLNVKTKDSSNPITGVTLSNSILWGNEGSDTIRGALVPAVVTNNLFGDSRFTGSNGNFYDNPQFVEATSGDYRLQSTSPCVDAGDPTAASLGAQDLDDHVRLWDGNGDAAAVVDLGAWEYASITAQEINIYGNGVPIVNGPRTG